MGSLFLCCQATPPITYCTTGKERQHGLQIEQGSFIVLYHWFLFPLKVNYFCFVFFLHGCLCRGEKKTSLLFLSYFIMWCYLVQHLLWTCLRMWAFDLFIYLKIVFFCFFFLFPWPALLPSLCLSRFKSGNTVKGTRVANTRVGKGQSVNAAARLQPTSPPVHQSRPHCCWNPTGTNSLTTVV